MATVARAVRLQTPSGTGGTRTRTLSHSGSEQQPESTIRNETVLPFQGNLTVMPEMAGSSSMPELNEFDTEDLRSVVARLESLQGLQRSLNQPNPELDEMIHEVIASRPEWRQRIAVMTKSALLRKKILMCIPSGGRALGSAVLGTSHPWRKPKLADTFTDHNWPKASTGYHGMHYLPGGTTRDHDNVLRQPSDKIPMNPLLSHSECYSLSKAKRFHGTKENGELDKFEMQKKGTPGPGSYHKSVPRGPAFSMDGGETFHIGANHICPWKKPLGQHINPIGVDASHLHTAPCYSFSKTRRTVSETSWGHGLQDGGPVKSDQGCLSPGPVYEHHGSMRPKAGKTHGFRSKFAKSRSTGSLLTQKIRMVRMPEEAPPKPEATIMDIKDQAKP